MGTIYVTDLKGKEHEIEAPEEGMSVMEIIYDAGVPIKASCFGCCSCSTCHVYIDESWQDKTGKPNQEEEEILDMVVEFKESSRLSCQITYNAALDGLRLTLAEDTRTD